MAKKASSVSGQRLKTEGRWQPRQTQLYFLASGPSTLKHVGRSAVAVLVAVNELKTDRDLEIVEQLLDHGVQVMLDSGAFGLASRTARRRRLSHDRALLLPLNEVDGSAELCDRYLEIVHRFRDRLWGYVEIDLGGVEQKIETRMTLEKQGLRPIPVYHPLNDGWEYFDELAAGYDRICVGNLVQAPAEIRKRILATVTRRKRDYPGLWLHALGVTPTEILNAYPVDSGDSSSWLATVRWNGWNARSDLRSVGPLPDGFQYLMGRKAWDEDLAASGDEPDELALRRESIDSRGDYTIGFQMGAYASSLLALNWRNHLEALLHD